MSPGGSAIAVSAELFQAGAVRIDDIDLIGPGFALLEGADDVVPGLDGEVENDAVSIR
jgi:hypothetical protein